MQLAVSSSVILKFSLPVLEKGFFKVFAYMKNVHTGWQYKIWREFTTLLQKLDNSWVLVIKDLTDNVED